MAINQIGVIESLQGQVSVIHADGTTGLLHSGSKLYTGDTLITADDGTAEIRFLDGTRHSLGPEFTAILNEDVLDPGKAGSPFQPLSGDSNAAANVMLSQAGVVTALSGDVEVMHPDGRSEAVQVGDVLNGQDVIFTASNGSADLALPDGSGRHIGPDLKASPLGEAPGSGTASPSALAAARAKAADIMQSILEGEDPTESAEVSAAGEEAQGDSGSSFVRLEESGRRVTPESGHETTGISYGFTEIQVDLLQSPVNRAPELQSDNTTGADDDILSTKENTPIAIDTAHLLANDTDPDGDTLTLVSVGQPTHGSVELLGDQVVFTPDPDFFGMASFQYTVSDGDLTTTASVTVHVDSVPDAGDDFSVVDESAMSPVVSSGSQTVSVDFGDEGPGEVNGNGSFSSSTALTSAGQAVVVAVDADGNYSGTVDGGATTVFTLVFEPSGTGYHFTLERPLDHPDSSDPDDALSLDFGYTATDANGDTVTGIVRIGVNDDGPSVTEAGVNTAEDTAIGFNVFDYASAGADGAVLKDVSLAVAGDGVITAYDATGNITYMPAPGFDGVAIVNYTIEDGDGDQATGQVTIDVGADSLPTVTGDSGTVDESALAGGSGGGSDTASGSLSIETGGDTLAGLSVNGEAVAAAGTTQIAGAYGELIIDIDGNWTYTLYESPVAHPVAGASDAADVVQESFAILVTDSDGDQASATLRIDVTDDGPVAVADGTVTVNEGGSVVGNLLANDTPGADGAALTHVNGSELMFDPQSGEASVVTSLGELVVKADGSYRYTANDNSNGTDAFSYTLTDTDGDGSQATVSFALQDTNVPVANDSSSTVHEAALPGGSDAGSTGESTGGVLNFSPGGDAPYTLSVNGEAVAAEGTTQIAGDYGELSIDIDGNWTYTLYGSPVVHPVAGASGAADVVQESFAIQVTDSDGDEASATLRIDVTDDGPVAVADGTSTAEDAAVTYNVLANDTAGADGATLQAASLGAGAGSVSFTADGAITYIPLPGFEGNAVIDYTIVDADGDPSSAQLTISVAADSQPVVQDSSATVDESALAGGSGGGTDSASGSLSIETGGDTLAGLSVNGEAVAAAGTTQIAGAYGELSIDIGGNWTYTLYGSPVAHPGAGATGPADVVQENFTILVTDSDGDEAGATLSIDVTDDGPVAVADGTVAVDEGASVTGNLLANDTPGADGATLTHVNGSALMFDPQSGEASVVTSLGELVVQADGGYRYTANDNSNGTDAFSYTLTDADGDGSQATISFALQDAHEPVAGDLSRTVDEAGLATGSNPGSDGEITSGNLADLGVNFHGDDPGSLSVGSQSIVIDGGGTDSITVNGSYGSWQIHDDGSWTYTLTQGSDSHSTQGTATDGVTDVFSYIATDSDGDQADGTLTVSVRDDVATALADPDTVALRDGEVSPNATLASLIAVAGADGASVTSVNGMELAGSGLLVVDGENGSLQVDLDSGTFAYHANEEDAGTDSFDFTVTDGDGDTDTVTVSYDVNDRPNFAAETYVWMPVDQAQQAPGYESGYPIGLEVSDLDSTLTVVITEVPDDGQAGYYDDSNTFVPLAVGDAFVLEAGEVMPQVVYIPPAVDLETVVDPITDVVAFTVTEDGDPLSTQSGSININAMPPYDLPSQEALIGDGNTPLTSGNDQEGVLQVNGNLITAITRDIGDDGVINTSFIELYTDFQERPSSGGVPIPDTHRADAELEATVTASVVIDGITFTVIGENDAVNQWGYDSESGLMKAVVGYDDIISADTAVYDGSLADYLGANPPEAGDSWTVIYQDSGSGNEQARFLKFDFAYDNPGDPAINVVGGADAPNIMYGSTGNDQLTGGASQDQIMGRDGNDVLVGGGGDDLFVGGEGDDSMTGGAGGDRFVFNAADEGVDTVTDYSNNESDVIDISDILTGFDPENDNLSDFVSITSDGTDATVAVDPGGGGAYTDVALLTNITAGTIVTVQVSEDTMETLIVA